MDNFLPEAPVIMFTNYKRSDGFEVSLTLRGTDLSEVATLLDTSIKNIISKGGTPVSRGGGFPSRPQAPTKPCPTHPDQMLKEKKLQSGDTLWSHSKGVYPNLIYCNGKGFKDELYREEYDLR